MSLSLKWRCRSEDQSWHHDLPMTTSAGRGGRRLLRLAGFAFAVLAIGMLSGGCVRARVAIAVSNDDLVTGEMVVAVVVQSDQEPGSVLKPPPELAGKIRSEPYRQDGYAGSRLLFTELTFDELDRLVKTSADAPAGMQFELRRAGGLVVLNGRVDLTGVPNPDQADVQLRFSFPGTIIGTNGEQQGETVSWIAEPGRITELTATARYAEPGTRSWGQWVLLLGAMAGSVVVIIALLAYYAHRRFAGRPARNIR
jgi:hypothetical protein